MVPITKSKVQFSAEIIQKFEQIENLDFSQLKSKLKDKEDGEGWSNYECESSEKLYKRFLKLILLFPTERLVPTKTIDTFWHYHILDTRHYLKTTTSIFGEYIHHYPYLGLGGDNEIIELNSLFQKTLQLYFQTFNENLVNDFPSKCDNGGGNGSTCAGRCYSK
jgi:hypothetical protein